MSDINPKHGRPINSPLFTAAEGMWVNRALRMHKEYRPNDSIVVDNVAVIVSRRGILYESQFRLLYRAVLIFKLNAPEEAKILHVILNGAIYKLREVMGSYGLDRDEGSERETE